LINSAGKIVRVNFNTGEKNGLKSDAKKFGHGNGNWSKMLPEIYNDLPVSLVFLIVFFLLFDVNISTLQEERTLKLTGEDICTVYFSIY
jgi:hypothetical protein